VVEEEEEVGKGTQGIRCCYHRTAAAAEEDIEAAASPVSRDTELLAPRMVEMAPLQLLVSKTE
jgi:hypothetical protein